MRIRSVKLVYSAIPTGLKQSISQDEKRTLQARRPNYIPMGRHHNLSSHPKQMLKCEWMARPVNIVEWISCCHQEGEKRAMREASVELTVGMRLYRGNATDLLSLVYVSGAV